MKQNRLIIAALLLSLTAVAAPVQIRVDCAKPMIELSPHLYGLFFEDINLSADGGLYPELVRNRSFEGSDELRYWNLDAGAGTTNSSWSVDASRPLNPFNRHSARVQVDGGCVLENGGYWGMNFIAGDAYTFKVAARGADGFTGKLAVQLCDASGAVIGSGEISGIGGDWTYHTITLTPARSESKGKLKLALSGKGTIFLDMVSLLPVKTWKNHGLRVDLAESMAALKPSFLRFPGGCWVEGDDLAHAYQWKNTVGNIDVRTPLFNIWDYNATHGLGYHEYLQLAEDLGAEPLFCINVGMSHTESVPLDRMSAWVQDALDAIEYANGTTNSVWGSLRALNGHPAPFNLRFLEIGNENGGPDYAERWPLFATAIKQKHPEITLIANHWKGDFPRKPMPEIVDEHYYETPEAFMRRATQYDSYDRKGPKVFVGEYAVTKKGGKGNLRAALGEAAFMTGMERNADVVAMAAYAPLFVNVNHRAWSPDLINFDSAGWYGIPGYYVQQMFSLHRGDVTLPIEVRCHEIPDEEPRGAIGVGTWNSQAEFKDIEVTAPDGKVLFASDFSGDTNGWRFVGNGDWSVQEGALRQMAVKPHVCAFIGDKSWKDYTIQLKARKLGGREGFLIPFHIQADEDRTWWNLGGWDNKYHAIGWNEADDRIDGSVETGRWYDIRVQIAGDRVQCWLDGKRVHDVRRARLATRAIYASATTDRASGDIILKVVNTAAGPTETAIDLKGIRRLPGKAQAMVLTSASPTDENSLAEPRKIAPRAEDLTVSGTKFTHSFPGNSVTVLRIPTSKK
jgi:alpha-L-arabinofuranosidase